MNSAKSLGRGEPRHLTRALLPQADRATLSYALLFMALIAGIVLSLGQAAPSASLNALFTTFQ
jgi:hypothetical protein